MSARRDSQSTTPLDGIEVVDLSRLLPGPACTWFLASMGARVTKVEEPTAGDYLRHIPPYDDRGNGAWFAALNRGKRSVVLDLRQEGQVDTLRTMLTQADVLVESFRPGVLARLGLAPQSLIREYPRLIVASITGYGQDGPMATHPGHDLNFCGLAGILSLAGRHGGLPDVPGAQVADFAGGALFPALAICAALYERERTGKGQWLDLSITDGVLSLAAPWLAAQAQGHEPVPGAEPLTGGMGIYRIYRCQDGGLVALGAIEAKFQDAVRDLVGQDQQLDAESLAELFATRPRDHWVDQLGHACLTPVLELAEVTTHPLHRARGTIVDHEGELVFVPGLPGAPGRAVGDAPLHGEHTEAVLAELTRG
ncbi:MAG: CaiB/BaiF CoA-transferase family protein, partial [Myxococcota bacterium]|nr:CaiB/BaiF CoA-transferase family protein [Myxococcota bacterium]